MPHTLPTLQLSLHLGTGHHHTLPVTTHQSRTLIVFGSTHVTEGEGNAWEGCTSRSNFSSVLGSFCPVSRYMPHSQHVFLQAILCYIHLPYKYQQIRQWPAVPCTSSQGSTLLIVYVDVSLRHMQHYCGWHQLFYKHRLFQKPVSQSSWRAGMKNDWQKCYLTGPYFVTLCFVWP